jgi:hypothetical protein
MHVRIHMSVGRVTFENPPKWRIYSYEYLRTK